jgi:ubiquinol-cytochrome c reductase iron-sulfur subunit
MSAFGRWVVALFVLLVGRRRRATPEPDERIVAEPPRRPRGELLVLLLLALGTICAAGFIFVYAYDRIPRQTQFLGLSLGLAFAFFSAASIVFGRRVAPQEELVGPYPPPAHEREQEEVAEIVVESGDRLTRRRLLKLGAAGAGATLGAALLVPAASLGPLLEMDKLRRTPWRRGMRLVDSKGAPLLVDEIEMKSFYTAFPEGADREDIGSPLVVVRVDPDRIELPFGRDPARWAPDGILAYSKICTHAGCAVSLYRTPLYEPTSARPALVCPCHYSTFDPAKGAKVLFGPAGRPLPQLPLTIGKGGVLVAGGGFSGAVGPSWWGVKFRS